MPLTSRPTSTDLGSSGCWREKARSRWVRASARCAPRMALSAERFTRPLSSVSSSRVALQRFEIADDDRKQIVEVMRNATGELADAFHFLRLTQPLLGGAPLRQVARDLGKSHQVALGRPVSR